MSYNPSSRRSSLPASDYSMSTPSTARTPTPMSNASSTPSTIVQQVPIRPPTPMSVASSTPSTVRSLPIVVIGDVAYPDRRPTPPTPLGPYPPSPASVHTFVSPVNQRSPMDLSPFDQPLPPMRRGTSTPGAPGQSPAPPRDAVSAASNPSTASSARNPGALPMLPPSAPASARGDPGSRATSASRQSVLPPFPPNPAAINNIAPGGIPAPAPRYVAAERREAEDLAADRADNAAIGAADEAARVAAANRAEIDRIARAQDRHYGHRRARSESDEDDEDYRNVRPRVGAFTPPVDAAVADALNRAQIDRIARAQDRHYGRRRARSESDEDDEFERNVRPRVEAADRAEIDRIANAQDRHYNARYIAPAAQPTNPVAQGIAAGDAAAAAATAIVPTARPAAAMPAPDLEALVGAPARPVQPTTAAQPTAPAAPATAAPPPGPPAAPPAMPPAAPVAGPAALAAAAPPVAPAAPAAAAGPRPRRAAASFLPAHVHAGRLPSPATVRANHDDWRNAPVGSQEHYWWWVANNEAGAGSVARTDRRVRLYRSIFLQNKQTEEDARGANLRFASWIYQGSGKNKC